MYVVGLTGPIASGKTTLANFLKDKGAMVVSADGIGHELLLEPDIKEQIKEAFGDEVFSKNEVDRKKLAKKVFSSRQSLDKLNEILWPPILKVIRKELQLYSRTLPANEIIIIDAPLLLEAGLNQDTDMIIGVVSSAENQLLRLKEKGYSEEEAQARMEMQTPNKELIEKSDRIIENNASIEDLKEEAEKVWHFIKK